MSDKKHRKYAKKKGRGDGQYMTLPYVLLDSAAWKDLSCYAKTLFVELRRQFNGSNNGTIVFSCKQAAERLKKSTNEGVRNISPQTAQRAFKELFKKGFIKPAKKGMFTGRRAAEWIITTERYNGQNPTNDYKQYPNLEVNWDDYLPKF